MSKAEKQELLRNAMVFISPRELSRRLRVAPSTLEEWISGEAPMPDGAIFVLVAMLNEIHLARANHRCGEGRMGVT